MLGWQRGREAWPGFPSPWAAAVTAEFVAGSRRAWKRTRPSR